MSYGVAPEAGRRRLPISLYSLPRSSLQGSNPWVVVEELAAASSSDRLRLVEDGVGFEPTKPLRRWKPRGSLECKSSAISRSAIRPFCLRLARSASLQRAFSFAKMWVKLGRGLKPSKRELAFDHKNVTWWPFDAMLPVGIEVQSIGTLGVLPCPQSSTARLMVN